MAARQAMEHATDDGRSAADGDRPVARLLGYGHPGVALLPAGLRRAWGGVALPEAVCARSGLPAGVTAGELDASIWARIVRGHSPLPAIRWLARQVGWHRSSIGAVRPVLDDWPSGLRPEQVPWSARTRNSLQREGLLDDPSTLPRLHCRHLLAIPRFGAHSLLDFGACAEAAFHLVGAQASPSGMWSDGPRDWAGLVSGLDPRFSDLLGADPRPVAARLAEAAGGLADPETWRFVNDVLPAVAGRVAALQAQPLEEALLVYLAAVTGYRGERLGAVAARLGWTNEPTITLQAAADRLGLSRERVRQLEVDARRRLEGLHPWLPQLDEALGILAEDDSLSPDSAARLLAERGVASQPFDAGSLAAVARDCQRDVPAEIKDLTDSAGEQPPDDASLALADQIAAAVQLEGRRRGAALREEVADVDADPDVVAEALAVLKTRGLHTTQDGQWLFFPPGWRSRVMGAVRDMLAVTDPLPLLRVHDGVERRFAFRRWGATVPPHVLGEVLTAHPRLAVVAGQVSAGGTLDWREELSGYERLLVSHLLAAPDPAISRPQLLELFELQGYSDVAAYQCWNCSVVLDHLGDGRAALVGRTDPVKPHQ